MISTAAKRIAGEATATTRPASRSIFQLPRFPERGSVSLWKYWQRKIEREAPVAFGGPSLLPTMPFAAVEIIPRRSVFLRFPGGRDHGDPGRPDRLGAARDRTAGGGVGGGPMLSVAPAPVIFMHTDATDMRKSFTGLCGIIRGVFGDDPADGSYFLLINLAAATGSRYFSIGIVTDWPCGTSGWKRGTFEALDAGGGESSICVRIDATELAMLLSGLSRWSRFKRRKRYRPAGAKTSVAAA